jgi:hypothetical protein
LGAGASGLATETSAWLTAHNGATGVAKIHAIGGVNAVSAAQLTAADAAGTISGPVATVTALQGQSSVTVAFSQTVTKTSAELATGYSIFGPGTPPAITAIAYSSAKNNVTLTLNGPLQTTDVVRVNSGIVATSSGLSVAQTDYTVVAETTKPVCTTYASTGNNTITITCNENIQVADAGTINDLVDTIKVGGTVIAAGGAFAGKVLTVTLAGGATFTATGAAIVIPKDIFEDLAGNNNAALSGITVTDTKKPTVVGLPTYAVAGKVKAQINLGDADGRILFVANTAGSAGNSISVITVDDNRAGATADVTVAGTVITITSDDDHSGASNGPTTATIVAAVNAHPGASALVTAYISGTTTDGTAIWTDDTDLSAGTALGGGSSTLTVTTTFSEAVVVDAATDIKYNANGADGNEVNYASVSGSGTTSVVTTYTLNGTTHQADPAANTSEMLYAAAIPDLAGNTVTAVTPLLSAP